MSDLPDGLQVGDEVKCLHCPAWHPAYLSSPAGATAYERAMLAMRCAGQMYFVGTVGTQCRHPARAGAARESGPAKAGE